MHSDSPFCHNCGVRLSGPYCAACGQKAVPLSVTLRDFLHELTHETLHVDGRVFQSIRRLLLSPGFLTREYVEGRRARWISPIRLYLIFSVVYFTLSVVSPAEPIRVTATGRDAQDVAAAVGKLGYSDVAELQAAVTHAIVSWVPRAMFVLMPVFACFVAATYRRANRTYLHHLYFALHMHAAWFALGAFAAAAAFLPSPISDVIGSIFLLYGLIYTVRAFRAVYARTMRSTVARTLIVMVAYLFTVALALAAIVASVLLGWRWWSLQ